MIEIKINDRRKGGKKKDKKTEKKERKKERKEKKKDLYSIENSKN